MLLDGDDECDFVSGLSCADSASFDLLSYSCRCCSSCCCDGGGGCFAFAFDSDIFSVAILVFVVLVCAFADVLATTLFAFLPGLLQLNFVTACFFIARRTSISMMSFVVVFTPLFALELLRLLPIESELFLCTLSEDPLSRNERSLFLSLIQMSCLVFTSSSSTSSHRHLPGHDAPLRRFVLLSPVNMIRYLISSPLLSLSFSRLWAMTRG